MKKLKIGNAVSNVEDIKIDDTEAKAVTGTKNGDNWATITIGETTGNIPAQVTGGKLYRHSIYAMGNSNSLRFTFYSSSGARITTKDALRAENAKYAHSVAFQDNVDNVVFFIAMNDQNELVYTNPGSSQSIHFVPTSISDEVTEL